MDLPMNIVIGNAISLIAYGEDPEDIFDDWNEDNISGGHVFSFHDKWNIFYGIN